MAMGDIADHATLVSGRSWQELREMLDNQAHEPQPQIYSVKAVTVPEAPLVVFSQVGYDKTLPAMEGKVRCHCLVQGASSFFQSQ